MIDVEIDEFTPCLKDCSTGELVDTEVIRITRHSFLSKYNRKNGWYVNWDTLLAENEVYALVLKGTVDIQGLVAIKAMDDFGAVFITWMCTSPENNPLYVEKKKYSGVGGHLFAIAVEKSLEYGYEGAITGYAANRELVKYYCEKLGAVHIGTLHPYQIFIDESAAIKIREVYDYEWTDDKL